MRPHIQAGALKAAARYFKTRGETGLAISLENAHERITGNGNNNYTKFLVLDLRAVERFMSEVDRIKRENLPVDRDFMEHYQIMIESAGLTID